MIAMDDKEENISWYKDVVPEKIEWLWYPYIPFGKISLLQGAEDCGKVTVMIDIITKLTMGDSMPDSSRMEPINVAYFCTEDKWAGTIRPTLESMGTVIARVKHIKEDLLRHILNGELIENEEADLKVRLLVIDPLYAYTGNIFSKSSSTRKDLSKLRKWASANKCAVVLIGSIKTKRQKDIYRGLGSVEIMVMARSVMQIDRSESEPQVKYLRHIKSNLTAESKERIFKIDDKGRVDWLTSNKGNPIEKPDSNECNSRYEEV